MKLDMELSCRSRCEIVKGTTVESNQRIIGNSTDQIEVQAQRSKKVPKATKLAQKSRRRLLEEVEFLQTKAQNFEVSSEQIKDFVEQSQELLNRPSDEINL